MHPLAERCLTHSINPVHFAAVAFVVSQLLWMRHFSEAHHSTEYVMGFLTVATWLIPFTIFVSMSSVEGTLPSTTSPVRGSWQGECGRAVLYSLRVLYVRQPAALLSAGCFMHVFAVVASDTE